MGNVLHARRFIQPLLPALLLVFLGHWAGAAVSTEEQQEEPPAQDHIVAEALERYYQSVGEADEKHRSAQLQLHEQLIRALDTAQAAAMQQGRLAEANLLQAQLDAAWERAAMLEIGQRVVSPRPSSAEIRSRPAVHAIARFDRGIATTNSEHAQALRRAHRALEGVLEAEKRGALREASLAEANEINTLTAEVKRELERRDAQPATLFIKVKGSAEIFVNDDLVGTVRDNPLQISLLSGDMIFVRARSPFVYRFLRVAIVPEQGEPMAFTTQNCLFLGEAEPKDVTPRMLAQARRAGLGRPEPGASQVWRDLGAPDIGEWIGLPDRGKWYLYAFAVP